jgi:hypothetical protein
MLQKRLSEPLVRPDSPEVEEPPTKAVDRKKEPYQPTTIAEHTASHEVFTALPEEISELAPLRNRKIKADEPCCRIAILLP